MTQPITPFAQPLPTLGMPSAEFTPASNGFMLQFPGVIDEMNAQNEENNALNAAINAQAAAATAQASAASLSAGAAAVSAAAAAATSTAPNWVSGTTYAVGNVRRSLVDGLPYQRLTAGAGTTDPRNDPTNWVLDFMQIDTGLPNIRPTLRLDPVNAGVVDSRIVTTRASEATYWDEFGVLRTAPANTLRIDHDPVTGECLGYLAESAATNSEPHPFNMAHASWVSSGGTKETGFPSVDGGTKAVKLVENTSTGEHQISSADRSVVAGTRYCSSWIVKAGERTKARLSFAVSGLWPNAVVPFVRFDLSSGQVVSSIASGGTFGIEPLSGGRWLIWLAMTAAASGSNARPILLMENDAGTTGYTGDGVSGLFAEFAQWETGVDRPTSPILTASARAADVPFISGTAFSDFYNPNEGTFVVEAAYPVLPPGAAYSLVIQGVDVSNLIGLRQSGMVVISAGVTQVNETFFTPVAGVFAKQAMTYRQDQFMGCANGGAVVTDTTGNVPAVDRMRIYLPNTGGVGVRIKSITYYPRAVTATQLQALSRI